MLVKTLPVGQIETNCYVVTNENTMEGVIIDPGDESNTILDYVEDNKIKVKAIFLTHGHFDHVTAAETVSEETGAPIWINEKDTSPVPDMFKFKAPAGTKMYKDGDIIAVAGMVFQVIETPGHSAGSVTLICQNALFTGDTLFRGSCGRVDLPGGNMADMSASLRRLYSLEDNYEVYPGHMDATTLDVEKRSNPFMTSAVGE